MMNIRVFCYEGYVAGETPRAFFLGDRRLEVREVIDRWRGEDYEYFKLNASDGNGYIIRHDREKDMWQITMFTSGAKS